MIERSQPLDGLDLAPAQKRNGRDARKDRLTIDHDGARAALTESAAELRAIEPQIVAKDIQQRRGGIAVDAPRGTVDVQCHHGRARDGSRSVGERRRG